MNIRLALAQYALDALPGESAPDVALALLEAGYDSSTFGVLATMRSPTWRDARDLFEEGIAAAGLTIPTVQAAQAIVVSDTVAGLADGSIEPRRGAGTLWSMWHDLEDRFDLSGFIGLADEWDDHPDERGAIEADIVAYARELRHKYPRAAV